MKKTIIIYGLLAAVVSCCLFVFIPREMTVESMMKGMFLGYACFILSAVLISFGIASYKKNYLGGSITYLKAISVGLLTALVASTIYVAIWVSLYKPLFPDFGKKYAALMKVEMMKKGESEKDIKDMEATMERYDKEPLYRAATTYMEPLSVQVPIVLIASIFISMRKRKKLPEFDFNKSI